MSNKTLYLHIGTNKTGTTTIQRFMAVNRAKLAAQGVFYPLTGATSWGNHSMYARDLQRFSEGKVPRAAVWESFLHDCQQTDLQHVVVSGEVFWSFKGGLPYFRRLQEDLCANFQVVKVVCYLRRQDDYLRSCYTQAVKSGRSPRSFDDYIKTIAIGKKIRTYEYDQSLALWAEAFGRENILVRPFERGQLHPGGLIADFCACCGIAMRSLDEDKAQDINLSPGRRVMAAMLYAQQGLPRIQGTGSQARRQTALCSALATRLATEWDDEPFVGFRQGEARAFFARFQPGNACVAREYLERADGRLFYSDAFAELPAGVSDDVTLTQAEKSQVDALVAELRQQLPDGVESPD